MLGIQTRSSGRAAGAPNHRAISLVTPPPLLKFLCLNCCLLFPSMDKDWTKHARQVLYD